VKTYDIDSYKGGWFIGDFEPSIWRTSAYEVGYKHHVAGEEWPVHYHEHMDEVTFLLEGEMLIQGQHLVGPVIFELARNEIADPIFVTDCKVFVIKAPSVPGDKIEIPRRTTNDN
jgi:hypothetical protein